jgi:hypothetical protein
MSKKEARKKEAKKEAKANPKDKHHKRRITDSSSDEDSDDDDIEVWETDDDDSDDDDDDEEEEETDKKKKHRKHKVASKVTVCDSDEEEEKADKKKKHRKQTKPKKTAVEPTKKKQRKHRKHSKATTEESGSGSEPESDSDSVSNSGSDSGSGSGSESESDSEDDDNKKSKSKKPRSQFNIVFSGLGGGGGVNYAGNEQDMDSEELEDILGEDDDDEYATDEDERTFMKETYEPILAPLPKGTKNKKRPKRVSTPSTTTSFPKKGSEVEVDAEYEAGGPEVEYYELIGLKKHVSEKLEHNPNNKLLQKTMKECKKSIQELVKSTRMQNTKEYYKLITADQNQPSEFAYFKKKLSHTEQKNLVKQIAEINQHLTSDIPQRITLLKSTIPAKYKAVVMNKLNMLQYMEPGDSEYSKLKNWVDTFMRIPIDIYKEVSVSYMRDGPSACDQYMRRAKKILDDCVYGHDQAKMQIMQVIGQWITNPSAMGTAIAIKGPPGTGKSSLVKEGISKILGREFALIALGGTGDASFLEGHSYTYEGSSWGKIVQILIDGKCMNPVIYFDELDKVSDTARGQEIVGVLTHLTDTTQNNQFHDKYFSEIDFDLSKCLFIFSYNDEELVNPILRDRMYCIQTAGYDVAQKVVIAKQYLLPKIRAQVNFQEGDVVLPDEVLRYIISNERITQKEDGVRNLKRCLEIIHTKLNLFRLIHTADTKIEAVVDANVETVVDPKVVLKVVLKDEANWFLGKDMPLNVSFPYTVTSKDVDILIRHDEKQNHSLLSMYV